MAEHPTLAELLIAREEALEPESRRILEHVARCQACRQMAEELDGAERQVADYWTAAAGHLPSAPPVERLSSRLSAEVSRRPLTFPMRKAAFAAALAACILLVLYLRNPLQPESVEAADVLRHATEYMRTSDLSSRPRAFEMRSGQRVLRGSVAADPQLVQALDLAYVNWRDPLNPGDFARWRDAQSQKTDRVTRDSGWVRLTTTVLGDGPVRSASITVSQPDWRPIARKVEFRDRESVEVREISGAPPLPAATEAATPQPTDNPDLQQPTPTANPGDLDLEVRLWEAIRRTDADVLDGGVVRRDASGVCYEVWPDAARKDVVTKALGAVSGARTCTGAAAFRRDARVLPPLSSAGAYPAPYAHALETYFGGREPATRYVDEVLQQHVQLLARVTALERFLRHFTPNRFDALPEDQKRRLREIAAEHAVAIRSSGAPYLDHVAQGLAAAAPERDRLPQLAASGPARCQPNTSTITSLAADLKALQAGFNKLFGGADPGASDEEPGALLLEAHKRHAALTKRLAALCVANE